MGGRHSAFVILPSAILPLSYCLRVIQHSGHAALVSLCLWDISPYGHFPFATSCFHDFVPSDGLPCDKLPSVSKPVLRPSNETADPAPKGRFQECSTQPPVFGEVCHPRGVQKETEEEWLQHGSTTKGRWLWSSQRGRTWSSWRHTSSTSQHHRKSNAFSISARIFSGNWERRGSPLDMRTTLTPPWPCVCLIQNELLFGIVHLLLLLLLLLLSWRRYVLKTEWLECSLSQGSLSQIQFVLNVIWQKGSVSSMQYVPNAVCHHGSLTKAVWLKAEWRRQNDIQPYIM